MARCKKELSPNNSIEAGRFMITYLVDDSVEGQTFEDWPNHITILPWFTTEKNSATNGFTDGMNTLSRSPVTRKLVNLGDVVMYGDDHDVPVREVTQPTLLVVMHSIFLARFNPYLDDSTYTGDNYSPHMSVAANDPGKDSSIVVDSLCLIQKGSGEDTKTIVCTKKF